MSQCGHRARGTALVLLLVVSELTRGCYIFPAEVPDPCRDRKCPYGARCVPSMDGRTATCECPARCPVYGDHAGSRPVCGSDGVDYRDQCELRRAACTGNAEITVKFHGKCADIDSLRHHKRETPNSHQKCPSKRGSPALKNNTQTYDTWPDD
uniref:Kazal-like domain-containing protein n=1 Tax=Timema shepardi TaxID=629360 RepID=A0A7R9AVX2_TIMSH|nr:unnamed protein product [Timema shepardi]